jgi:hypothetical protein
MTEDVKKHSKQSIEMENGIIVEVDVTGHIVFLKSSAENDELTELFHTDVEELNRVNRIIWSGRILPENVQDFSSRNKFEGQSKFRR